MRILVPVDGREMSLQVIDFLKDREAVAHEQADIEFFFAEPTLSTAFANRIQDKDITAFYDERSQEVFDLVNDRLGESALKASFKFHPGNPADCILQEAKAFGADIIIMGTRGHSARTGFLFGSVSNAVVAKTECPVLIIQGHPDAKKVPKIGIAVDGSEWSERAVKYLIEHRNLFGKEADVKLIHVANSISTSVMPATSCVALSAIGAPSEEEYAETVFNRVAAPYMHELDRAGISYERVALIGIPGQQLARYVENENLDLMVLGSHGYGNFKAAILGSVAMTVASSVEKPLLIIR